MQTLYADVLYVIDFSMDVVSLWLTSRITYNRANAKRVAIGASVGALISTLCTALDLGTVLTLTLGIVASLVMCRLTFGELKRSVYLKTVLTLWIVGALIGGVMTMLAGVGRSQGYVEPPQQNNSGILLLLPAGAVISFLFVTVLTKATSKRRVRVSVTILGERREYDGIVDSGNLLRDPISATPVIVVHSTEDSLDWSITDDPLYRSRVRMIPARSIFGEGLLVALRPDEVTVDGVATCALVAHKKPEGELRDGVQCIVPSCLVK